MKRAHQSKCNRSLLLFGIKLFSILEHCLERSTPSEKIVTSFHPPVKKTTHMREIIFQILGGSGIGSRDLRNVFCMTTRRNTPLFTEFRREFISL